MIFGWARLRRITPSGRIESDCWSCRQLFWFSERELAWSVCPHCAGWWSAAKIISMSDDRQYLTDTRVNNRDPDAEQKLDEQCERVWREFWVPLLQRESDATDIPVTLPGGWFEQIKAELFDYHNAMSNLAELYCDITGGRISKIMTEAHAIAGELREVARHDACEDIIEHLLDARGARRPDDQYLIDELVEMLRERFGVDPS